MVFGKHLIIDACECDEHNIKNIDVIDIFIEKLCNVGNMTRKGDLIIETFPENDFNIKNDLVGFSIVQIISLSNITLHINFISRTVYFDFFTCGEIKEDRIIEPLEVTDWLFQLDDKLPQKIEGQIFIPKEIFHRIIKGRGDLKIKLIKL